MINLMARTMKPKSDKSTKKLLVAPTVTSLQTQDSDLRLAELQSSLIFYRNRSRLLERDMMALRDALKLHAPGNGATLPSRKELQRLMAAAPTPAIDQSENGDDTLGGQSENRHDTPDADRARIHELEKQIHALQGVMRSPPVRLARIISRIGRDVKRALRGRKQART